MFRKLERVYREHFTEQEGRISVISPEDLVSSNLQSPDDGDATYRNKNGHQSRGQTIHISETATPGNAINIITDVAVAPNNTDDSAILNDRLGKMKSKTGEFSELHSDGGYGSLENDKRFEFLGIDHIQTAVRGREVAVSIKIRRYGVNCYEVSCPFQQVLSSKSRTRHKAEFDIEKCENFQFRLDCPTQVQTWKPCRVYYFTHFDYLSSKRHPNLEDLPLERQKLRANVEATLNEFFVRKNRNGKLRVRGRFKTEVFALTMAIGINFGRIYRNMFESPSPIPEMLQNAGYSFSDLWDCGRKLYLWL